MMLASLLINGIAILISAYILPGVRIDDYISAFIVAIVLALANILIKPVLLLLTLPLTILTLGLFAFIINGIVILIVDAFVAGFHVDGLLSAILFSLAVSLVSTILRSITKG